MSNTNRLILNQVELGKPLPAWSLEPIFGEPQVPQLNDYLGKPLLLFFFSLGCPSCLGRALPYANRVVYENNEHIEVLGIHTNFEGVDVKRKRFEKAKEEFYIRFPIYKDKNFETTFLRYRAGGTPHWILVDKSGNVQYSIFGSDPNNALLRLDLKMAEVLNS